MPSPKTVPNGRVAIEIGMLSIPVTIGKATVEERESSLIDVAITSTGVERIRRNEHLASGNQIDQKAKAVQIEDGNLRLLNEGEMAHIEASTKSSVLTIVDVQPLKYLPLVFSTGT